MKNCLRLMTAVLTALILAGCSGGAALPPRRTGLSYMKVSLEERYTVASAMEESDLVILARVGDWLGENAEQTVTYYRAEVLKTFKDNNGEGSEIVLIQDGDSESTVQGYPLFTAGNELLLFLKKASAPDYENAYWMAGSFAAFFDAARDKSGRLYYLDRYGIFGQSVTGCENLFLGTDRTLIEELRAYQEKTDSLASERQIHYVFSADELERTLSPANNAE